MQTFIDILLGLGLVIASALTAILVAGWVATTLADLVPDSALPDRWRRR